MSLSLLLALVLAGSPWPLPGHDPANTGWNPTAPAVTALRHQWTIPAPVGVAECAAPPVPPVVAGGRLFLLDRSTNGVAAHDAATGARLWTWQGTYYFRAARLAVAGDLLIVVEEPCHLSDEDTRVAALDVATGALRWQRYGSWRTPGIVLDRGILVTGGNCPGCISDIAYRMHGVRVADGTTAWESAWQDIAGPVSANGRILVTAAGRDPFPGVPAPKWTLLDIRTGKRIWHTRIPTAGVRAADPGGERLYLAEAHGMRVVAAATGRRLWATGVGRAGGVAVDDRRVYVSFPGQVRAYDAGTGRFRWARAMTAPGRPVRAGSVLYVPTGATMAILDPASGSTVALSAPFRPVTGPPVVADGRLYLTDGATVRAYA
ncbi:outer membrane protein assembly factor BamB family protein [Actinoplanes sp. RD1]|uniref:outer membrane protein assembly factor BamB family protein n=1 Tax=Actinoplanes sp. RD1 TaxID=3064538 RepID=UPI002741CC8F|nr:PQQ-binding-like beta-propeller repeat protein [Actinoplanes sp. RD1]